MEKMVLFDQFTHQWLEFSHGREVFSIHRIQDIKPTLRAIDHATQEGLWAVGFLSYEAAQGLDPALITRPPGEFPLLLFGIFDQPQIIPPPEPSDSLPGLPWRASIDADAYRRAFEQVKGHIARGDTYQVNLSFRLRAPFTGDPWQLFTHMIAAQETGYHAYLDSARWSICSASPELFFSLDVQTLTSLPMKGTAARGLTLSDDLARANGLKNSLKDRAENVMIVDMVRNDMGRIASTGSVRVPRLFDVEKYPTLWQMTSTVTCQTAASITDIFTALFPAASITGAPKARTMSIIHNLESLPRNIYTGTIGYIAPGRRAQFNVAIRTVLVDKENGCAEYGIGGGLVWDSGNDTELEECYTKARILTHAPPSFALLETVLWLPESGFALLPEHLSRLEQSAQYFSIPVDREHVQQELNRAAQKFPQKTMRARLTVSRSGLVEVSAAELAQLPRPYRVTLAKSPIQTQDAFLVHKTTHRTVYENTLKDNQGADDVLLWNEQGEITESCIANVIFEKDGAWYTPPLSCGLLPGIARAALVRDNKLQEQVIKIENLPQYSKIFLINSVRGMWEILLEAKI